MDYLYMELFFFPGFLFLPNQNQNGSKSDIFILFFVGWLPVPSCRELCSVSGFLPFLTLSCGDFFGLVFDLHILVTGDNGFAFG